MGVLPLAVFAAVDVGETQDDRRGFTVHAQLRSLQADDVGKVASHVGGDDIKVVAGATGEAGHDPAEAHFDLRPAGSDRAERSHNGDRVPSCPHHQPGLHVAAVECLLDLDALGDDGAQEVVELTHPNTSIAQSITAPNTSAAGPAPRVSRMGPDPSG